MREASEGHGIDRHMLGLRCMVKDPSESAVFQDPAYAKSCTFRLSSSNMSPGTNFYGGFGPVVPNGYGINYAIDKDALKFSISCKASCKEVSAYEFRSTLERSLKDMMELFPLRYTINSLFILKLELTENPIELRSGGLDGKQNKSKKRRRRLC
jgi:hypothetical protein